VLIVDALTYDRNGIVEFDHDPEIGFLNGLPQWNCNETAKKPDDHCTSVVLPLIDYSVESNRIELCIENDTK
jgi:hypothetical protein